MKVIIGADFAGFGLKEEVRSHLEEKGVDLIIGKPFQLDQLLRMVQEGMEIKDRLKDI